jgi:hypothetical protein
MLVAGAFISASGTMDFFLCWHVFDWPLSEDSDASASEGDYHSNAPSPRVDVKKSAGVDSDTPQERKKNGTCDEITRANNSNACRLANVCSSAFPPAAPHPSIMHQPLKFASPFDWVWITLPCMLLILPFSYFFLFFHRLLICAGTHSGTEKPDR